MKRVFFTALSIALTFASCQSVEQDIVADKEAATISVSPTIASRATDLDFEQGDQIALTIMMDGDNSTFEENAPLSYSGSKFSGDITWYTQSELTSNIIAYYPYVAGESLPTSFAVQADQSTAAAYTASDLMFASKSGVLPSAASVAMTFDHSLSRVVVQIDNQSGQAISSVEVCGSRTAADINVLAMSVALDESSAAQDISAFLSEDGTYKAIIIPQSAALTFRVTLEDGSEHSFEKNSVVFVSGGEYTAQITLAEEDSGSSNIVSFEEYDTYFIYDGVTYNTELYSITGYGDIRIMVDNMSYIPQGVTPSSDPSDGSGLWYPYSLAPDPDDADADYIATALSDAESIAELGYLYNFQMAIGEELTRDNYNTFEGAQGICPPGWHIPTKEELYQLTGGCISSSDISTAPFYDLSVYYPAIQKANELGFNHTYPGAVTNNKYSTSVISQDYTDSTTATIVGKNSTAYYMGSTANSLFSEGAENFCNFFALMTSHATAYIAKGKISVLYCNAPYGVSLRCIKDNNN